MKEMKNLFYRGFIFFRYVCGGNRVWSGIVMLLD